MQTDLDRKTDSAASLPHLVEMLAKEACSSEKPCDYEWCNGKKKLQWLMELKGDRFISTRPLTHFLLQI